MMLKLKTVVLIAAFGVMSLGGAAQAKWWNQKNRNVDHNPVNVGVGQIVHGDVVSDKSITVDGEVDGDCISLGGPVTVSGRVTGDVVSAGGQVEVSGTVRDDVVSMGGPVEISGNVGGNVSSVGGGVVLKSSATINGDVSALGGKVEKGDAVQLKGDVQDVDLRSIGRLAGKLAKLRSGSSSSDDNSSNLTQAFQLAGLLGAGMVILFSMFAVGLLLMLLPPIFFPRQVGMAANAMRADMWKSAGIGLLIVMAIFPSTIFLVVSIIGIPLVPLALLLVAAAGILGWSAFSMLLCDRFFEGIKRNSPQSMIGKVCAGYLLVAVVIGFGHAIPFIGGIISLAGYLVFTFGMVAGLGAAWLTRLGTRGVSSAAPVTQIPLPVVAPVAVPVQPAAQPENPGDINKAA
jgi:cytoskeletal protein CcmA (bactofilin family)